VKEPEAHGEEDDGNHGQSTNDQGGHVVAKVLDHPGALALGHRSRKSLTLVINAVLGLKQAVRHPLLCVCVKREKTKEERPLQKKKRSFSSTFSFAIREKSCFKAESKQNNKKILRVPGTNQLNTIKRNEKKKVALPPFFFLHHFPIFPIFESFLFFSSSSSTSVGILFFFALRCLTDHFRFLFFFFAEALFSSPSPPPVSTSNNG